MPKGTKGIKCYYCNFAGTEKTLHYYRQVDVINEAVKTNSTAQ